MAFILPKGIVKNSNAISGSIESIASQPLDPEDIAKFWRVYTTTTRRLLDPTAERLENYWWRIWGSQRRELDGATVARLFAHISDGQSFVPLRGPANRDEGTPPLNRTSRHGPGAISTTAIHDSTQPRPSTTSSPTASKPTASLPHPILKKGRGPSLTGPRPTARFISPHESDAETVATNSSDGPSSPNSHVVVQPPSPDLRISKSDKKVNVLGSKKKGRIVPSTAAKKRPVITRRQSSQSSTDSAAKVESQNSERSSSQRTLPTFSNPFSDKGKAPSKFQENFSPDHLAAPSMKLWSSSKSGEQEHVSPDGLAREGSGIQKLSEVVALGEPGPSSGPRSVENRQLSLEDLSEEELELQRSVLQGADARLTKISAVSPHEVLGENDSSRGRQTSLAISAEVAPDMDMSGIRLKSVPSLAPTLSDAAGQLDMGNPSNHLPEVTGAKGRSKGKGRDSDDMFTKQSLPTISGKEASTVSEAPLSKSKSQLTLLLQKDRARKVDQKFSDGRKQDRKR